MCADEISTRARFIRHRQLFEEYGTLGTYDSQKEAAQPSESTNEASPSEAKGGTVLLVAGLASCSADISLRVATVSVRPKDTLP